MAIRGGRVPTLKMKPGWEAQPIAPLTDWSSTPVIDASPTVDELTAQLSNIIGAIAQARGDVWRCEQRLATAQVDLAEEQACLANLEASYADARGQLIQACKRDT